MKCCAVFCKLFKLLCWPPCPQQIVEHFAFQPPPPTYDVQLDNVTSKLSLKLSDKQYNKTKECLLGINARDNILDDLEVFYTDTKYSTKILCVYYAITPAVKTTILYSHGNASDLGFVSTICIWLAKNAKCNVLAYDYTGYGRSTGKPSEKKMYADIQAAYKVLQEKYGCEPKDIVLLGQSLGSAPSVELASKAPVGGLIIQSGFVSALNVVFHNEEPRESRCDFFNNGRKISKVTCPVLVIHGTNDNVVSLAHGRTMYESSPNAVQPLWVDDRGHNDVELSNMYIRRVSKFLELEVPQRTKTVAVVG